MGDGCGILLQYNNFCYCIMVVLVVVLFVVIVFAVHSFVFRG